MITKFKLFERKGNYQLFHKTGHLSEIIESGYIKPDEEMNWWDTGLRKNVFPNWKEKDVRFKTISATRNFNYSLGDTIEFDVEKISDRFRIIPFSENPDFYIDFQNLLDGRRGSGLSAWGDDLKKYGKVKLAPPTKNDIKSHSDYEISRMLRSKSKGAGELFWRVKTDNDVMDFGIAEELIVVGKHGKLDVGKYVKRIFLNSENPRLEKKIKEKYPHIEVIVMSDSQPYYKKRKYQKEPIKQHQEA